MYHTLETKRKKKKYLVVNIVKVVTRKGTPKAHKLCLDNIKVIRYKILHKQYKKYVIRNICFL